MGGAPVTEMDTRTLDQMISRIEDPKTAKIPLLQALQGTYEYLPEPQMKYVAQKIGTSYQDLYGIATFYAQFNLAPPGRHTIFICEGTACHVKGGQRLRAKLKALLGINVKETTRDRRFTLKSVRCLGCCGISPVLMIDGVTFARVKPTDVGDILSTFS